ncbi:ABC transporter substrate-binding protein [Anaeromicropila herbilytica]|uniref:ABC transporter substrate-binding protein n=1 Tax=Anaeromicropila herbilytica TaxID=2785025 RepID=A0A7R7EMQ5_9FIRM|nr:ABC transporter substrate-binding protein [Anaeromicropila herbilytica]BCN31618.1 ABC transporter substrate-binding protein [Anaeromicropila herbilytica]
MMKKIVSTLLVMVMCVGLLSGCGSKDSNSGDKKTADGKVDTSKEVNLVLYLYGGEGVANKDILAELNKKLKASINTTLEVKYIDWADVNTKYPLLWTSGEQFDMAYVATSAAVPYSTLAKQDALVDISDMIDTYAPKLKTELADRWNSVKVNDKIYAVPNNYSEYTAYGFITRKDIMDKYGISSIASIADMETYMDDALKEKMVPLNGNSNLAMDLYRMLIGTTKDWIDAPGIPSAEMYLAAGKDDAGNVFHPAFTDEFEAFAVKMHEWAQKGYWTKDVLSAAQDDKDNFYNGLSASYISHQPDWTGNYGNQMKKLPGVDTEFYTFPATNKIIKSTGVGAATAISANSKYPERCLMVIEKLMTDKECYDLFQYGIEGKQYVLSNGNVTQPAGFNAEKDGGGFAGWAFRTDKLNIPAATEDPRRYILNKEWEKDAIDSPYIGFNFDSTKISSQLSAIANVDSQLGIQILLGKTSDPKKSVAEYRKQLKAAGIDDVIKEVNKQYSDFAASK